MRLTGKTYTSCSEILAEVQALALLFWHLVVVLSPTGNCAHVPHSGGPEYPAAPFYSSEMVGGVPVTVLRITPV